MNAIPARVCERLLFNKLTVAIRPPLSFQQFRQGCAHLGVLISRFFETYDINSAHIAKHSQLIEISTDGLLLTEDFIEAIDDDDLSAEACFGNVVREGQPSLRCFVVYGGEVFLADAYAHFFIFHKMLLSEKWVQGFCPQSKQKAGQGRAMTSQMRCLHSLERE